MKSNIQNLQQKQAILRALIFTLVTVMIWVSFSIFRSQRRTAISSELILLSQPLNPNIDMEVVNRISQKRAYSAQELSRFTIYRMIRDEQGEDRVVTELSAGSNPAPQLQELLSPENPETAASPSAAPTASPSGSTNSTDIPTDMPTNIPN